MFTKFFKNYLIAKNPSKQPYLKTVMISLKPARFKRLKLPEVENGSRTPFKELLLAII